MADGHDENKQTVVLDAINDAVVANAKSQVALLASLKCLDAMRPWILGQQVNLRANLFTKAPRERLNRPQSGWDDRDGVSCRAEESES